MLDVEVSARRRWRGAGLTLAVCLSVGSPTWSQAAPADFPKPAALQNQVAFWKRVFVEWSEHQVAIHDNLFMGKIYSVIDLRPMARNGATEDQLYRARKARTDAEKNRIDAVLGRLHAKGANPASLTPEERTVADLFRDVTGPNKYLAARGRIRAQQGLREKFERGVEISRRYLPHMEEIFRQEGLPLELTRMPFIESTFNVKAYSKVGAAGIWQFIPSSARIYHLRINEVVDDRRDPLVATRAAARHLRDDYAKLGTWPLAVTAYNHGRGGIARAVRTVGSRDLAAIIQRYQGRAFGFASRNFYASFLAALEVEREYQKHFPDARLEPKLEFDGFVVRDFVAFPTLARMAGADVESFHELNPAFDRVVVDGKLYVPKGYSLRLPKGKGAAFSQAYAELAAAERHAAQRRYYIEHRVAAGQTVGAIARRYGSSAAAIQTANGLRSIHQIRIGQILRVPAGEGRSSPRRRGGQGHQTAGQDRQPAGQDRQARGQHRVASGETVGGIARRYGTTVARIQAANGLRSAHQIRIGQVLEVPSGGSVGSRESTFVQHRVSRGQTVGAIARRYGTTVSAIREANDLGSADLIHPGQVLRIPAGRG